MSGATGEDEVHDGHAAFAADLRAELLAAARRRAASGESARTPCPRTRRPRRPDRPH